LSTKIFYSHGKLLISGEYVVLDGAEAFAIPTNKGQYLTVKPISEQKLVWKSFDEKNNIWFEDVFVLKDLNHQNVDNDISKKLIEILLAAQQLNPLFLSEKNGFYVTTKLTFNREYGLGTSSTLIANISKWAKVDAYQLLWNSFKGSGYDLACALNSTSLVYRIQNELPLINEVNFNPNFKNNLYFVYLNNKQDSKEGISLYKSLPGHSRKPAIAKINKITKSITTCKNLSDFNTLLNSHENTISKLIRIAPIQERLFSSYKKGIIKSLGAWGGDFVMVTIEENSNLDYFRERGYNTIYSFKEMLL
jgi:mevalonate kinase